MYLLFDIGGTNIRMAVSRDGNTIPDVQIVPTPKNFEEAKEFFRSISQKERARVVSLGVAGTLDRERTTLVSAPHLQGWVGKPLKQELQEIFQAPVFLENDSALGGLGEALSGAGKGYAIVGYLAVGTGVGGARIVNGVIDENALGFEPGHQLLDGKMSLEEYVSGSALAKRYGKKAEMIEDRNAWEEVSRFLALGLHNTIVHWSPDVVVLGGSVMEKVDLERTKQYLAQILTIFPEPPSVVKAILGERRGLEGALAYAKAHS
ncbi:MAG: ROK family protein [bacterium]|nr:ROK family protein [bacterium]